MSQDEALQPRYPEGYWDKTGDYLSDCYLMQQARLRDVQARLSDAMRLLAPPLDTEEKQRLFKIICDEGYGQPAPDAEQRARWKANLVRMGISEEDAETEIARELAEDFLNKGPGYTTVYTSMLTWSFGRVEK